LIISIHGVSLMDVASTPKEAVDIAAEAGFEYIEIPLTTWEIDPQAATGKDINRIRGILSSGGIEARSLGMIWPTDQAMITDSPSQLRRNINYARALFDLSAALGIETMNLGGHQVRRVPPDTPYYEGLKTLVRFWREACRYAEDVGVIVCIEHIVRRSTNVANTTKQIMDLVEAIGSPSFQINAQVHQMAYADLDVPTALRASGEMIKLVHIADVAGFNPLTDPVAFITPGRGRLDFVSVFRAFKDIGYDGEFCMEPSPHELGEDPVRELREGRELLEAKWKEA